MSLKRKLFGIKGNSLDWFRSYLGNRKQAFSVNGIVSQLGKMELGVVLRVVLDSQLNWNMHIVAQVNYKFEKYSIINKIITICSPA